ncbi:hypothetical protein B0H16DRAFT_1499301 [Mycena metata]|uniref:MYND-type domain-containing protein n=1 Tax=Mycena metata TaxID=1033252 RepID=A0AAD7K6R9_9AGAR|nr:hypothetical protein B0H16DRAFT_1499301 [Mycena metata]
MTPPIPFEFGSTKPSFDFDFTVRGDQTAESKADSQRDQPTESKAHSKRDSNFRGSLTRVCTNCVETHEKMLMCSKCKFVWYCSKECQIKHWPMHKKSCTPRESCANLQTLLVDAFSNALFNSLIQSCFVLHFNLHRGFPLRNKPFGGSLQFGIEPVDFRDFVKIFFGDPVPGNRRIQGMVQINSFRPWTPSELRTAALSPGKLGLWRKAKDEAPECSVGILEAMSSDAGPQSAVTALIIRDKILDFVREAPPWKMRCPFTDEDMGEEPFNIETTLECLNLYIRNDSNNEMGLRTELRPCDIKLIRDTGAGSDSPLAKMLREKMARESIYGPGLTGRPC